MADKELQKISKGDLQKLIESQTAEKKTLEFKANLKIGSDSERKEFLADVSSFANTVGGDVIFGISEDNNTGLPNELIGIQITNPDNTILQIEGIIRDGLQPRLAGVEIVAIPLSSERYALIIRISPSWNPPHRVIFKSWSKFFARTSKGKFEMDVDDLKNIVTLGSGLEKTIKDFVDERIYLIYSGKAPIANQANAKIVMHLIPFSSFRLGKVYDLKNMSKYRTELRPMGAVGWDHQYTVDGYLAFQPSSGSYSLFFRNGVIEAVNQDILQSTGSTKFIPAILVERTILEAFDSLIKIYKDLRVDPPFFVFITLIGVKDHEFEPSTSYLFRVKIPHNKEVLTLLPGKVDKISSTPIERNNIFRPIFDSLWNAYGHKESTNFTPDGNWAGR